MRSNNIKEFYKSHHRGLISNSRVEIPRQKCHYAKEKGKCRSVGVGKSYKTRWSLLHHLLTNHRQEPDFKEQYSRIYKLSEAS